MTKTTIVYPGTFDPFTHGHVDIIERAAKMFEHVIVAVAESKIKTPMLSIEARVTLAKKILKHLDNVEVESFNGLTINFAKAKRAKLILRGLRDASDLNYEFQLADMNRKMMPTIETIFLLPSPEYANVSATVIREIAMMGGDLSPFVHPEVAAALQKK